MADGKVVIETDLDSSGIEKGLKNTEKSMKAQAATLAAEYRKQGMNASDAFKKAWSEIERSSGMSATSAYKHWEWSSISISGAVERISNVAEKGLKVATAAITGTATALAGAATAAAKTGADFESQMSRVKAISGATGEDFEKLRDQAIQLGADTSFSASSAAEGMENLAAAGFEVNEITEAMPGLLALAAASGEDLAVSSDIAASAIRGFGLDAEDAAHVADVLAANANKTNSSVSETGEALKYIAPLAQAAGIEFEETAAAIGIMANAGIQGSQAGTTLRSALSRLSKPTSDMQEVMDELGISFYDSEGKMKSLSEQVGMLRKATEGMTDEQRNNYLVTLYGQEALSGMLALINAGEGSLQELTSAYENSDGAAQAAADTMQDNLAGAMEQLGGSAETLGIVFYDSVSDNLKAAAESATDSVNEITEAFQDGGLDAAIEAAGDEFADLAVEVADHAPEMVDAAVDFVDSFGKGIKKNKKKLVKAAGDMAETMAGGLAKLLPDELEEPVEDAIDAVSKSLNSGGLKKGAKTFQKTIDTTIDVVGELSDVALPALTEGLDFVGEHLDVIVPVVGGATAAFLSYKVATTAMTAATNLATKAQAGLNAIMTANPIVLAAAGITAGITAIALATAVQVNANKELKESNQSLGEAYGKVGDSFTTYLSQVSSAGSIFDDFNDSIIVSNEKQAELVSEMESVQNEITEIANTATEERRKLTQSEVDRLDELFSKMRELTDRELEYQRAYQDAVKTSAETLAATQEGSAEEYASSSQKIVNSAIQTRDQVVDKAYAQMNETNAINKQLIGTSEEYTQEWYNQQAQAAQKRYQQAVTDANREASDTLNIIQQGYADRMTSANEFFSNVESSNRKESEENRRYNAELADALEYRNKIVNEQNIDALNADNIYMAQKARAEEEHKERLAEIRKDLATSLTDSQAEQAGVWLAMIAQTSLYGGELDAESQRLVDAFIDNFDKLPEGQQEIFKNALQGAVNGFRENEPQLLAQAQSTSDNFLNKLKTALGVHSPSVKVEAIFSNVNPGAVKGLDSGKEELYEKADEISEQFLQRLSEGLTDTGEMVAKGFSGGGASKQALAEGKKIAGEMKKGLTSQMSSVKSAASNLGKQAIVALKNTKLETAANTEGKNVGKSLKTGISSMDSSVRSSALQLANKAEAGIKSANLQAGGKSEGREFGSGVDSGIKEKASSVYSAGASLGQSAKRGLSSADLHGSGYSQGVNFSSGLASGIRAGQSGVISAASAVASAALEASKRRLDINSPSGETEEQGRFFDEGYGVGIEKNTGKVVKSVENLNKSMLNAMDLKGISDRMREVMSLNMNRVMMSHFENRPHYQQQSARESGEFKQIVNFYQKAENPVETSRVLRKEARRLAFAR